MSISHKARSHKTRCCGVWILLLTAGSLPVLSWGQTNESSTPATPGPAASASTAGFETFIVPNPVLPKPGRKARASQAPPPPPMYALPLQPTLHTQATLSLSGGTCDLDVAMNGQAAGHDIAAQFSPSRWLRGEWWNTGYFQSSRNGQGVRLGSVSSDMFGSAQGMHLFGAAPQPGRTAVGLGIYQHLGQSGFSGALAADGQWQVAPKNLVTLQMATDSSWRFTQQVKTKKWEFSDYLGNDATTKREEGGVRLSLSADRHDTLFGAINGWSGTDAGHLWSGGLTHNFKGGSLCLEHSDQGYGSSLFHQTSATVLLPLRGNILILRGENDVSTSGGTADGQHSRSLLGTYLMQLRPGASVWCDLGLTRLEGAGNQQFVTLGLQQTLTPVWSVQASITDRQEAHRASGQGRSDILQPQIAVGCRINRQQQVRLLWHGSFGGSQIGDPPLMMQLVQGFDTAPAPPSGTVEGRVLLDGGSPDRGIVVVLDGTIPVTTTHAGVFRIPHVPIGPHSLQLSLQDIPANIGVETQSLPVDVQVRKAVCVEFRLHRVGQIQGWVKVEPDAFGVTDSTAGLGITITAGDSLATTTDADSHFTFGTIPLGHCRIALAAGTIPPDFHVVGPDHQDVDIQSDHPLPPVEFTIAPIARPIDMTAMNTH